jgi:hypothetical protein
VSLDAKYLFCYEPFLYLEHPKLNDIAYLRDKYGGEFIEVDLDTIYWDKPKFTLPETDISNLMADQILERKDCELWEIIK